MVSRVGQSTQVGFNQLPQTTARRGAKRPVRMSGVIEAVHIFDDNR